jgi:hypothetical protein
VHLKLLSLNFHLSERGSKLLSRKLNFRNVFESGDLILQHESELDHVSVFNPILSYEFIIGVYPPALIAMNQISKIEVDEPETGCILFKLFIFALA